ncbi:MAG: LysR family transcriptional regulator [Lachnospiraceae bacterium]|nr:LysR family transcriptional regulator [Lachnospiraceae bacterium]
MTITQLTTFLKIAEHGNFSAAANTLGYAQSTVTMQIKQLEEELGTELFDRLGKSVSLTAAGRRLLVYAEKMLQLEREILADVPAGDEPTGTIKLGISESFCYNRFPKLLLEYTKLYPKVDLQLSFINHDTFPDLLKKGALDLVYTLNPLIERDDLRLLYKKQESLGFFVSPKHPFAEKQNIREKDLEGIPLLLTSHNCNFRHMLIDALTKAGIRPRIALETSSKEILKQFAINELGVAFMPEMVAEEECRNGKLVRLTWEGTPFNIYSQVFVHKDKHINKAIKDLLHFAGFCDFRKR